MPEHMDVELTTAQNMTDHLSQRVTVVERNLDGLREQAAHTQAALSSLRTESAAHTRDLHDIKEALTANQQGSRTKWEVIAAWLGVAIIIATLAFAPVYRDLGKVERTVEERTKVLIDQAYRNGQTDEAIATLKKKQDALVVGDS